MGSASLSLACCTPSFVHTRRTPSTPASSKMGGCAVFCMINSAVGVPFLCFLGFICSQKSPMIEAIPNDQKEEAGMGCYMAAVMYMVTFVMAYVSQKKEKKASAREVEKEGTLLMPVSNSR